MSDLSVLVDSFIANHANSSDEALARALVVSAGTLAQKMRAKGLDTDVKTSLSDVVTDADRAAEEFVATVLERLRSKDGLVGEEGAQKNSSSGRTWVVDPVDGTYNFTSGSDYWCSALALIEGDPADPSRLVFGAVHRPIPGTTWCGGPDMPTTVNGVKLETLAPVEASKLSIGTYLHPQWMKNEDVREAWTHVVQNFATLRMFGAGSVDLAGVAAGQLGAWMQHSVADWDWLPGKALVEGVGGQARKVEAAGVTWCVAGNAIVVDNMVSLLQES